MINSMEFIVGFIAAGVLMSFMVSMATKAILLTIKELIGKIVEKLYEEN